MKRMLTRTAAGVALGLMLAGGAMSPALAAGADGAATAPQVIEQDKAVVNAAINALNSGGYPALKKHIRALTEVMTHAPDGAAASPLEAQVYGTAAMGLTMYAVETHAFDDAVTYGNRGLALMPDSALLATETAGAYAQLRQFDKSLALLDAWLAAHAPDGPEEAARFQRSRGFALIELNRLDEAEAAYQASLKLEPGHRLAQEELTYIGQLRQGAAKQAIGITTVDEAKTGGSQTVKPTGE